MKYSLFVVLLLSMLIYSCDSSQSEIQSEEIVEVETPIETAPEEVQIKTAHLLLKPALFKVKLENDTSVVLLDIRTPQELAENGTIDGAINVDFYAEDFKDKIDAMDRETPVMLYCRSGGRSGEAAAMLKDMGFEQVYDLNGGYNAWLEAGF